ncbi:hypothetical protein F5883DRAFT_14124 [Diaporthe sp. PMI_573]|nr:hypothetical protein F5883DRAFT_14124 [Diaporthaceae sp. PMI_573]
MPHPIHMWPSRSLSYLATRWREIRSMLACLSRLLTVFITARFVLPQLASASAHPHLATLCRARSWASITAHACLSLDRRKRSAVGSGDYAVAITPAVHYPAPCASSSSPGPSPVGPWALPVQPVLPSLPSTWGPRCCSQRPMSLIACAYAPEPLYFSSPKVA